MGRRQVDDLDGPAISARVGAPVTVLASTRSTQDDARAAAAAGAPRGAVFVADVQEAGRGRQGRVWVAPVGTALLASVVLRPEVELASLPVLALVVGLAVADAIAVRVPDVGIKWPNDVLVRGRKIAGVLVEAQLRGTRAESVVAGFGVNVRSASLPDDVAARAISLEGAGASPSALDRGALLGDVATALSARIAAFEHGGLAAVLPDLRARDVAAGRRVEGDDARGVAVGIADDGRLLVDVGDRVVSVGAGEVRFV